MIPHQSFSQWQQNPIQGVIPSQSPFAPADENFLTETLVECRARLQMALETAQGYSRLPDLATALGDAVTGCEEALTVLGDPATYLDATDAPDEPYDVARSLLPPTKGKIQPPESAF
jgi:hypothetical protein